MTSVAKRQATYQDLLALPDDVLGEIIDGDLVTSPRPSGEHTHTTAVIGMGVGSAFHLGQGGPGGWWILDQPEMHLHADVLVPDLAGWRRERMPAIPADHRFVVTPDWVCEVISPSSVRYDRIHKLRIYAREGVKHAWIVDPINHSIEVFRNSHEQWILVQSFDEETDSKVRIEPFDSIILDLATLWAARAPLR